MNCTQHLYSYYAIIHFTIDTFREVEFINIRIWGIDIYKKEKNANQIFYF